jgi:glycosyltransferase involved in cell wall biosynthesis
LQENKSLHYLGVQSDVRPFIEAAHVVVLPSYREGIPRVLLEAMALEKPFVTVNSPGCADVTRHGINGLIAEVASSDSLFKAMDSLYCLAPEEREAMGKAGRKHVTMFYDEKIVTDDYFQLILSLS